MPPLGRFAGSSTREVWFQRVPPEPGYEQTPTNGHTVLTTLDTAAIAAHTAGPWGAGFGWFFLLIPLFWIGVLALFFLIARRARWAAWNNGHGPHWSQPARSAESTLAERFAQGDIEEKEYRARLEVLRANSYRDPSAK